MATRRKAATSRRATNTKDSSGSSNDNNVDLIDEHEQEKVIKDLQLQCITQTHQIGTLISFICFVAGAASLASQLVHEYQGVYYSLYPLYVAFLHALAGCIANDIVKLSKKLNQKSQRDNDRSDIPALFVETCLWSEKTVAWVGVAASSVPILSHVGIVQTTDVWVWVLTGSNIYTVMAALYMKRDSMITFAKLFDLKDSTYKHKSL